MAFSALAGLRPARAGRIGQLQLFGLRAKSTTGPSDQSCVLRKLPEGQLALRQMAEGHLTLEQSGPSDLIATQNN